MNRAEFIAVVVAELADVPARTVDRVLHAVESRIVLALVDGEKVQLSGFLTCAAAPVAARNAVNPRTGETVRTAAKLRVKIKAGKRITDAVNLARSLR